MTPMLTVKEAALFTNLSVGRIRQLLTDKTIKAVKIPTTNKYRGEWRINKDSLINYLATRRKAGRPRTK